MSKKKDELAVLFPEQKVGPYTVRPWTLAKLVQLYPVLLQVLAKCQEKGLTVDNFDTFFSDHALELVEFILPALPELMAATLDLDVQEAGNLVGGLGAALALAIFNQNVDALKNSLSLVTGAIAIV
jgi:hypothetical protein